MKITHEMILRIIEKNPGITTKKIKKHPACPTHSFSAVHNIRYVLVDKGLIIIMNAEREGARGPTPYGYIITEAGIKELKRIDYMRSKI